MVTTADETSLEINIDELCGYSVREVQSLTLGTIEYDGAPFTVGRINKVRRRQISRRSEQSIYAGCLENCFALLYRKAVAYDIGGSRSGPGRESVLVFIYRV